MSSSLEEIPGDPGNIRVYNTELRRVADAIDDAILGLERVRNSSITVSKAVNAAEAQFDLLIPVMQAVRTRYESAASILDTYASSLDAAQTNARGATATLASLDEQLAAWRSRLLEAHENLGRDDSLRESWLRQAEIAESQIQELESQQRSARSVYESAVSQRDSAARIAIAALDAASKGALHNNPVNFVAAASREVDEILTAMGDSVKAAFVGILKNLRQALDEFSDILGFVVIALLVIAVVVVILVAITGGAALVVLGMFLAAIKVLNTLILAADVASLLITAGLVHWGEDSPESLLDRAFGVGLKVTLMFVGGAVGKSIKIPPSVLKEFHPSFDLGGEIAGGGIDLTSEITQWIIREVDAAPPIPPHIPSLPIPAEQINADMFYFDVSQMSVNMSHGAPATDLSMKMSGQIGLDTPTGETPKVREAVREHTERLERLRIPSSNPVAVTAVQVV